MLSSIISGYFLVGFILTAFLLKDLRLLKKYNTQVKEDEKSLEMVAEKISREIPVWKTYFIYGFCILFYVPIVAVSMMGFLDD